MPGALGLKVAGVFGCEKCTADCGKFPGVAGGGPAGVVEARKCAGVMGGAPAGVIEAGGGIPGVIDAGPKDCGKLPGVFGAYPCTVIFLL